MPLIGMGGSTVMLMPWLEALEAAVENDFEAFEVFAEFPQCVCEEVGRVDRQKGRELVESSGIALAVHAPFNSLNIAALNPGVRRESVRQTKDAIDLCADLGGQVVVVHNGEYITSERFRKEVPEAGRLQWDHNLDSLREAAGHAEERGLFLCLENIGFEPDHMDRCVDDLLAIREEVDEKALRFCLDIGHARLNRELDAAVEKMGPWISHVHFTDNRGKYDDHMTIGEGNFDYRPLLDFFRKFDRILTLEVFVAGTDPRPALQSRQKVKEILGL